MHTHRPPMREHRHIAPVNYLRDAHKHVPPYVEPPPVPTPTDPPPQQTDGIPYSLTQQFGVFNPRIKGQFEHISPDDPYFSPEQVKGRAREQHQLGHNYCGPRTEFEARNILNADGTSTGAFYKFMMERAGLKPVGTEPYSEPTDFIDKCAFEHDRVFTSKSTSKDEARTADLQLIRCLKNVPQPSGIVSNVYAQVAAMAIKYKIIGEDVGLLPKGYFSSAQDITPEENERRQNLKKAIEDVNKKLVPAKSTPETIADDEQTKDNFWVWTLMQFFKMNKDLVKAGVNVAATVGAQVAMQKIKNSRYPDLSRAVPGVLSNLFIAIADRLRLNRDPERVKTFVIQSIEAGLSEYISAFYLQSEVFNGVTSASLRFAGVQLFSNLFDEYFNWLGDSYKSDAWRGRNILTQDEVQEVIDQQSPRREQRGATRPAREVTEQYGMSLVNPNMERLRQLCNSYQGLTQRQKVLNISAFWSILRLMTSRRVADGGENVPRGTLIGLLHTIATNRANGILEGLSRPGDKTLQKVTTLFSRTLVPSDIDSIVANPLRRILLQGENEALDDYRARLQQMSYIEFISTMDTSQTGSFALFTNFANLFTP